MTTGVIDPGAAALPPPKKNVFARFAGVLFAPADAFQEIVRRPDIVAPLLLILALSYTGAAILVPHIDLETVRTMQREQILKRSPGATEADLQRFGRIAEATMKVGQWVAPLVGIVFFAVAAGVLLLGFRLMGGDGGYKQAFSVTLYAWAPLLVYSIVTMIVVLARGTFDPIAAATLVKSNPAFLVDLREQPVLYALLSSLDVFSFWALFLFTLGFSAMSRLSKGLSAAIVIALWGVMVLVKLGFSALQS